jgi:hypothetical protein
MVAGAMYRCRMEAVSTNESKLSPFLQATCWHKGRRRRGETYQARRLAFEDCLIGP